MHTLAYTRCTYFRSLPFRPFPYDQSALFTINGEDHYRPDVTLLSFTFLLSLLISLSLPLLLLLLSLFSVRHIRIKKHLIKQHETLARACEFCPYRVYVYKIRIHSADRKNERGVPSTASLDSNVSHKLYKTSARSWEKQNSLDGTTKKRSTKCYTYSCHEMFAFHSD